MNIYSASEIKERITCEQYIESQGHTLRNGRCNAWWRGGVNMDTVHVDGEKWYDFALKQGGSVIDLCAVCECGDIGATIKAITILAERLNLKPIKVLKRPQQKTRSEILIDEGYKATATYDYTDENGKIVYSIVRFEKPVYGPGEHKQFVHRTPDHEGLDKDTPKLLYNLPAVVKAQEIFIVEGEKDAETIRSFGLVGTTNSGGASNWEQSFNKYFIGKDVIILADNDEPGQKHGIVVCAALKPVAKSVKVITVSSLPKGDVTDWVEKEGGTSQKLREIVKGAAVADAKPADADIAAAKLANENPFRNFTEVTKTERGHSKTDDVPIPMNDLLKELSVRFRGFPRNLGSSLFDWNFDKKEVVFIENVDALFAWIQRISKNVVAWNNRNGFVTQRQFFEGIRQSGIKYVGLSCSPHFPTRDDVFYTHDAFPAPDPTHQSIWRLIDFFSPVDAANRTLIAALFLSPIYYSRTASRPMWVVDTDDAQGSGKTTLVKMVAELYGHAPLPIDLTQLDRDMDQITKRIISSEGRQARIALIDNVTRTLKSQNLAMLVTSSVISGRPAYGRGEEMRPNDLTYVVTMNGAQTDTDLATRSYTIRIKAPENPSPMWEGEVYAYINGNRAQIFSDMLHMVQHNPLANLRRAGSRFGMFDSVVLSAVCKNEDEFNAADRAIRAERIKANEDGDRANEFMEILDNFIAQSDVDVSMPLFVRNIDVDYILSHSDGAMSKWSSRMIVQMIRQGQLKNFDRRTERIPPNTRGIPRMRGILYNPVCATGRTLCHALKRIGGHLEVEGDVNFTLGANQADDEEDGANE